MRLDQEKNLKLSKELEDRIAELLLSMPNSRIRAVAATEMEKAFRVVNYAIEQSEPPAT